MTPAELNADKVWASMHFGICSNTWVGDPEIGSGDENIDTFFNPTSYDGFDSWLDQVIAAGAKGVMLTTHYWEGFCLFPSATSTRAVQYTDWYAGAGGGADPVLDFVTNARAKGLKVGLYYNMKDIYYENHVAPAPNYTDWSLAHITQLLTNYGQIDMLFIDAWGDWWAGNGGLSYVQVNKATILNAIEAAQPNCLVTINDHQNIGTPVGDFRLWERTGGEDQPEPPQGYTFFPAVALHDTIHNSYVGDGSARWFDHPGKVLELKSDISAPIARRFRTLYNGYVWFVNFSPNHTGLVGADTQAMVRELIYTPGQTIIQDAFVSAAPVGLSVHNPAWTTGDANLIVSPSGSLRLDAPGSVISSAATYANSLIAQGRLEVDFTSTSDITSGIVALSLGDPLSSAYDSMSMELVGTTVTVTVQTKSGVTLNETTDTLNNSLYHILAAGSRHRLALEKRGTLLTGEFYTLLNGVYEPSHKLYLTSITTTAKNPVLAMLGVGTDTTGIHVTNFAVQRGRGIFTPRNDIDSNMIHRFALDEGSGASLIDTGTRLQNGTAINSPTWVAPGKVGPYAYQLGTFAKGTFPTNFGIASQQKLTTAFWIKNQSPPNYSIILSAYSTDQARIDYGVGGPGLGAGGVANNNDLAIGFSNGLDVVACSNSHPLAGGGWHHIAWVFDGTLPTDQGKLSLFVDGIATPVAFTATPAPNTTAAALSSVVTSLGGRFSGSNVHTGVVDEVRIYQRALTPADIAALIDFTGADRAPTQSLLTGIAVSE